MKNISKCVLILALAAFISGCGVFTAPSTAITPASSDVQIVTTTEITVTPDGVVTKGAK